MTFGRNFFMRHSANRKWCDCQSVPLPVTLSDSWRSFQLSWTCQRTKSRNMLRISSTKVFLQVIIYSVPSIALYRQCLMIVELCSVDDCQDAVRCRLMWNHATSHAPAVGHDLLTWPMTSSSRPPVTSVDSRSRSPCRRWTSGWHILVRRLSEGLPHTPASLIDDIHSTVSFITYWL